MEITRRQFGVMLLSAAALCVATVRWFGARAAPSRFLRALKPSSFPGRLHPLDEAEIRKPGRWVG